MMLMMMLMMRVAVVQEAFDRLSMMGCAAGKQPMREQESLCSLPDVYPGGNEIEMKPIPNET